jgi:hypothetical protein
MWINSFFSAVLTDSVHDRSVLMETHIPNLWASFMCSWDVYTIRYVCTDTAHTNTCLARESILVYVDFYLWDDMLCEKKWT